MMYNDVYVAKVACILLEKFVNFHLDLLVLVCFHGPIKVLNIFDRIPKHDKTVKT